MAGPGPIGIRIRGWREADFLFPVMANRQWPDWPATACTHLAWLTAGRAVEAVRERVVWFCWNSSPPSRQDAKIEGSLRCMTGPASDGAPRRSVAGSLASWFLGVDADVVGSKANINRLHHPNASQGCNGGRPGRTEVWRCVNPVGRHPVGLVRGTYRGIVLE